MQLATGVAWSLDILQCLLLLAGSEVSLLPGGGEQHVPHFLIVWLTCLVCSGRHGHEAIGGPAEISRLITVGGRLREQLLVPLAAEVGHFKRHLGLLAR